MMMTIATELVRFYDQALADDEQPTPARVKSLRPNTEFLKSTVLDVIEPDWEVEQAFGKLHQAAIVYSRSTPADVKLRGERFDTFKLALKDFAQALDGAEVDEGRTTGTASFCADQVPNPLASLA